nr:DNA-directed DNA polymerase [Tanacetum cinerariifolium]
MKMNTTSSLGSGTLPGNTITNPKKDLKGITTRSGTAYQGPTISTTSSLPLVVEREIEATKDTVHPTNNGSTKDVQPLVFLTESPILNSEPVISPIIEPVASPVSALKPNQRLSIPNPDQEKTTFTFPYGMFTYRRMPFGLWNAPSILSLPDLTPTCMTLELANRLMSRPGGVAEDVYVKVGSFYFSADFVVVDFDADPRVPLILERSFLKIRRALIDVFEGKLTLFVGKKAITFNLDQTSRYSANYSDMTAKRIDVIDMACEEHSHEVLGFSDVISSGDDKFPVIIAKDLSVEEKTALITVLKSHKRAIAWKLSDIKDIDLEFCTHKILMKEDFEPAVQHQRKVNPKIHDVIKQEVIKLLDSGLIDPIFDSSWVSPVHCVPKKGGFTVIENEDNELILTRLVTRWRVCIDYRKLNEATRKDHFPLLFMDQMLERLAGNQYYCFLDGTFQRCMMAIFHDMIEKTMEVLMDDFSVFGNSFQRCHAGFYRRFIKDFSKIARSMTRLLEKDTPFIFSKECVEVFQTLKRKLTEAPILIVPDWDMPFELMCDASDFAIGAILGQRQDKHFRLIHYASKTMTEAESNYTTTKKEMLAVVYAFEKFRSYLIMNKSIVYTDHSFLKYLFAKKDSKARLLCWVILLQEFTFKVIDTKGAENLAADHLS